MFFKKKQKEEPVLTAYISGPVIPVTEVNDPVFSSGALGDGIAIRPESDTITAPCDGEICMVAETGHALGISMSNGIQLILHIGLDTVSLKGQGFQILTRQGTKVKQGTPLLRFDRKMIEEKGFSTDCILVEVSQNQGSRLRFISGMDAVQNDTVIGTCIEG